MSTTTTEPRPDTLDTGGGPVARLLRHPLTWMLIGVVGVGVVAGPTASAEPFLLLPVLGAALAVVVYRVVMRFVARRRTPEIAARRAVPEALLGAALGLGFVAVSAAVVTALGGYTFRIADVDLLAVVAPILAVTVGAAVTEELMFRGFALQALERVLGSWAALAVTALFFGLTHLFNPGATPWSALAIAIEAGGLLGAAFLWRRNLWFVIGLHLAWNATVALLGIPVSGHAAPGLLVADVAGPSILTGGAFGIEGSLVTVTIGALIAVPMLVLARRRGTLLPARGRRP
ncbi:CPBP family intramembrane metalloprotease [Cellulosimicrobium cellulans]|uniref:CPBP family intramembrane glutamic endopeptidase n=1 Tax=Cellulosimicrobium cellulans TaxID=1710 RepID=UPI0019661D16|nr:CPBP family intramembrane glutamic endopeptidase [Cellulosimicrobium cellulans]MBN0041203.1 CPBP family intramembrane metalloprotease [Cellulosimicrobium cellulans]